MPSVLIVFVCRSPHEPLVTLFLRLYRGIVVAQVDLKDKWRNMKKAKVSIKKKPYEGIGERRRTIRWTKEELEALMTGVTKCVEHTLITQHVVLDIRFVKVLWVCSSNQLTCLTTFVDSV